MPSGMIAACFSPERLAARLPGPGYWRPYPAAQDRAARDAVHHATRDHLLGQAAREPRPVAAGRLVIAPAGQGRDLAIDYPHADFDARIEERRIDDPQLTATWGRCIYRIALAAHRPAAQGAAHLEISGL